MGGLVENAIFNALDALRRRDSGLARQVADEDDRIDRKRNEIETVCVEMLRREAPVASDLRRIISILLISSELERMGDYAKGMARLSLRMGGDPLVIDPAGVQRMAEVSVGMLKRALEAFLERDAAAVRKLAQDLATEDDQVDELNARVQDDLFEWMRTHVADIERATYLVWIAHNIERIADRSTNIAERAMFQATGRIVDIGDSEVKLKDGA